MPVALFTGLPGSGKTAQLVAEIVRLQEKEPGRPIFQLGINGLKEGLAIPLTKEMLHKWWELPQGSIICIDECQEDGNHPDQPISLMPKDRGAPEPWVQRITKVRHHGMDFLLTTQHPANMSAYVRRLVDKHVHAVVRGKGVRQTYTWDRCIDNPDSRTDKKTGQMSFASIPKETFALYKSSSLHTMKRRVPRLFWYAGALAVVGVFLAIYIPYRLHKVTHEVPHVSGVGDAASVSADEAMRHSDYAKWTQPRVPGLPWTAPMFDKLTVKADPRLYCIAVDDGRCTCNTEQGTHYEVKPATCRLIASNGLYDPFADGSLSSPASVDAHGESAEKQGRRQAALPPAGPAASSSPIADPGQGVRGDRAMSEAYTPPGTRPWVADAFGGSK